MSIDVDIQSSLYYYHLTLVEREDHLFCLVDLNTGEWYEKMTIYYIQRLLDLWNQKRGNVQIIT
ncbi:hypothetical protein [Candidatus Stoquefichus massiliensis]|uniref:hypothetical protein n=1 Tax=Candidatus Stoquefichus massiliensis TaxID=1470350 RepID=UPI000481E33B|nr:hypothetical protein [Candidatus Stoquefichus massiliensis]